MPRDDRSDDHPDYGDDIDPTTFEQIMEMDDDGEREFSREIVYSFFEQAKSAFADMDTAINERGLRKLSELGHYLKGSSATLGLVRVRDHCEKIQHLGAQKNEAGDEPGYPDQEALHRIKSILPDLRDDCRTAEIRLRAFYQDIRPDPDEEEE